MKAIKRLSLLLMLPMSLMLATSVTSANENRKAEKSEVTCEQLLEECAQVVKVQKEALDAVGEEREVREAIIDDQEKEISKLRKQRNRAVGTNVGIFSLGLLLLLL